jgi:hypothetical protein
MWIAARQGDRACISKVIMIPNFYPPVEAIRFPELNEFVASIHLECNTVEKFTKNLEKFRPHVAEFCAKTFNPIIEAARLGKSDEILLLLGRLPPTFQGAIYERLWVIKGSPMGVHHDFGGASFKHDLSLAPKFHASNEEKIQAIEQASSLVIKELIDDTLFLHLHTKPLLPSEQVQRLRIETIDNLFNHLKKATSLAEKKAALCELDTFCESFLGGAKASHELFGRIYHLHINLKDCIDDYKEPNHPRFGEAAFFQIDGVTTRDDVLVIAMSDLKELILSKM